MNAKRLVMLAALLLAGCGGSPDPTSTSLNAEPPLAVEDVAPGAQTTEAGLPVAADSDGGAAAAVSERFRLGVNYTRLSPTQPTSTGPDQVEVAEVFWYGCPHCYNFDPTIKGWQEQRKADYVNFVRIPAVWNPLLQLHARAFYTAEALGKGEEMHEEFFKEIHANGNMLDTEAKLAEFFGRFGVDATAFKTTFDSFAVHAKLERADELSRRYQISSVPSIVVNGKYATDGSMAGGYPMLLDLIDELASSERTSH